MSKVTVSSEHWERFAATVYDTWGSGPVSSLDLKPRRPSTRTAGFRSKGSDLTLKELLPERGVHAVSGVHKAAYTGDHNGIMRLVSSQGYGVLSQLDANRCSPLMYAVMADSKTAIETLMNFSAKKELKDDNGRTALHYAAFFGCHKSLQLLMDYACDWCPRDLFGRTSLHWAVVPQSTRCLAILLQHAQIAFGDINPCDLESMTPVHCAAQYCRPRHLELLDQAGCSFTMVDVEGRTALHWTTDHTTDDTLLTVLRAYPPLLNRRDAYGMTALHLAASKGSVIVVETLLFQEDITIEVKDSTGRTPLHWACVAGSVGVVTRLLQYGASESVTDSEGYTPLHCAVQHGHFSVVSTLVALQSPTHVQDKTGRTPLMWATTTTPEIMHELLSNKEIRKDVNVKDSGGKTALHYASEVGSTACIEALVNHGADVGVRDEEDRNALTMACIGGHVECIKTLAGLNCDLDSLDAAGNTAAHWAVRYCASLKRMDEEEKKSIVTGVAECLIVLGLEGANLDVLDSGGSSALHLAVECGSDLLVEAILRGLANPNVQDVNGYTALHLAVMQGMDGIVTVLLSYNAHLSLSDHTSKRYTPLDLAILYGHSTCIELLKNAGALSQEDIKNFAATCIQSVYRGYRTRKVYSVTLSQQKAATRISAVWRGHVVRRRYLLEKRRKQAATKIQAVFRGYLQKRRFTSILNAHLRAKEQKKLIEEFKDFVLHDRGYTVVEPLTIAPVSQASPTTGVQSVVNERRLRLEQAMELSKVYSVREANWERFRMDEKQRRIDKANRIEAERLAVILEQSQNRRKFIESKKTHTWTLRSQVRAAVVVQRAYRTWKAYSELKQRKLEDAARQQLVMETEAAKRIQIAWRSFCRHREFINRYYRVIPTAPTIVPQRSEHVSVRTFLSPLKKKVSFAENTLITGKPRHKLNFMLNSGIKLVNRPFTTTNRTRAPGQNLPSSDRMVSHLVSPRGRVDSREYTTAWANVLTSPRKSKSIFSPTHSETKKTSLTGRRADSFQSQALQQVSPTKSRGSSLDNFRLPAIIGK